MISKDKILELARDHIFAGGHLIDFDEFEHALNAISEDEPEQLYQPMTKAEHKWMDAKRHFENYEMMDAVWCHLAIREYLNAITEDECHNTAMHYGDGRQSCNLSNCVICNTTKDKPKAQIPYQKIPYQKTYTRSEPTTQPPTSRPHITEDESKCPKCGGKMGKWYDRSDEYVYDKSDEYVCNNLNCITEDEQFDPVYYWEHMSEEHKYSICEKIDKEIALRKIEEYLLEQDKKGVLSEKITPGMIVVHDYCDWLQQEDSDE